MRLVIFTEPQQGASYDDQRRVAQLAEEAGFDGFFRSRPLCRDGRRRPARPDRLVGDPRGARRADLAHPAGHAGHLGDVPPARSAGDQRRPGRRDEPAAGWSSAWAAAGSSGSTRRTGSRSPPVGERFDRLEEQLEIIDGLWTATGPYCFSGKHYQLTDSPALPKPVQSPAPADHRGRPRQEAHARAGGPLRGRVQHPVRRPRRGHRPSSSGYATRPPPSAARSRRRSRPPSCCAAAGTTPR